MPLDDPGAIATALTGALGAVGGAVATGLALRRKISRDSVAMAEDAVERRHLHRREADYEQLAAELAALRAQSKDDLQRLNVEIAARIVLQGDYAHLEQRYESLRRRAQRAEKLLVQHGIRTPDEAGEFDTDLAGLGPPVERKPKPRSTL